MHSLEKISDENIGRLEPEPCPLCDGKLWAVYEAANGNHIQYYTTSLCASCRFEIPIRHAGGYSIRMLRDAVVDYLNDIYSYKNIPDRQREFVQNFLNFINLFD